MVDWRVIPYVLIMEVIDRLLITFQNSSTWFWTAVTDQPSRESFQYQVQDGFHSQDDNTFFALPSNWNIKSVGMLNMVSPKRYVTKIFSVSGWLVLLWWSGVATFPSRKWIQRVELVFATTSTVERQNVQARTHCPVSTLSFALPWNLTDCQTDWLTDCAQCFSCKVWWHGERIAERISIKTLFYLMKISKQNRRVSQLVEMMTRRSREFPKKPLKSRLACWVSSRRSGLELQ